MSVARFGDMNDLLDLSSVAEPSDTASTQSLGDVAQSTHIALKRLAPVMISQSVRIDVAVPPGLLVRMRGPALADLMEELLAAAIDIAPASMLLLTATMRGDRVYISLSDDMPSAGRPGIPPRPRQGPGGTDRNARRRIGYQCQTG